MQFIMTIDNFGVQSKVNLLAMGGRNSTSSASHHYYPTCFTRQHDFHSTVFLTRVRTTTSAMQKHGPRNKDGHKISVFNQTLNTDEDYCKYLEFERNANERERKRAGGGSNLCIREANCLIYFTPDHIEITPKNWATDVGFE